MCNFGECELFPVFGNGRACASAGLMKGVFLIMRIYQPVRGVGGALRENSFVIIDDAGVEIGQGGLEYRVIKKMLPDRPLDIEMTMNAHPMASDTLLKKAVWPRGCIPAARLKMRSATNISPGWGLTITTAWSCLC